MPRYIDADKLIEEMCVNVFPRDAQHLFLAMRGMVRNAPTADVVEVIRCKDCKHAYFRYNTKDTLQEIYACRKRPAGRTHRKVSGDFFCKHGERKDT